MKLNWFFCKDSSHQEEGQPILCYCLTGEVVALPRIISAWSMWIGAQQLMRQSRDGAPWSVV